MHEIFNGLNPRGDARLLAALGLAGPPPASRPSPGSSRMIARVVVKPMVRIHSASEMRSRCARDGSRETGAPAPDRRE